MRRAALSLVGLLFLATLVVFGGHEPLDHWIVNGSVNAITRIGNTIYLGGRFDYVGPSAARFAVTSTTSGELIRPFPEILSGPLATITAVYAVESDGNGGWFIGGLFNTVGGIERANLAHILANGEVDPLWTVTMSGAVHDLELIDSTLYVAGEFPGGLAAIDVPSRQLTSWTPTPAFSGAVYEVAVGPTTVYAGGSFLIRPTERRNLAAFHRTTGAMTSFNAILEVGTFVYALELSGATLYVGGTFNEIGGQSRARLAALDSATGAATGWNPRVTSTGTSLYSDVRSLTLSGTTLYVGGGFSAVGGETRSMLAAVDAITGAVTPWNPMVESNTSFASVEAIEINGSTAFIAGEFRRVGGVARRNLAAVDLTSGAPTAWASQASNYVFALATHENRVAFGGAFRMANGVARKNLAAIDVATGHATTWNPEVDGLVVYALANSGTAVYVGGTFQTASGQPRNGAAAFDSSGGLLPWNPGIGPAQLGSFGGVTALAVDGQMVYLGGNSFTSVGGQSRDRLAAVHAISGAALPWNPSVEATSPSSAIINTIVPAGSVVYAGGSFSTIAGVARANVAAIDAFTGVPTGFRADTDGFVAALTLSGSSVYIGGNFSSIGGQARLSLAALNAETGAVTPWTPSIGIDQIEPLPTLPGVVRAIAVSGSTVYVGGIFNDIGGLSGWIHLAGIDSVSALPSPWSPSPSSAVHSFSLGESLLLVGGEFTSLVRRPFPLDQSTRVGYAAFQLPTNGHCEYSLRPTSRVHRNTADTNRVNVSRPPGCGWSASSNASWITVSAPLPCSSNLRLGDGCIEYRTATNTSPEPRTGTLTIAGQTFTVTQAATCTFSITPSSSGGRRAAFTGSFSVTTPASCSWTAASSDAWLTLTSGTSGMGNGTVAFSTSDNATGAMRQATVQIIPQVLAGDSARGVSFFLIQGTGEETSCTYSISPLTRNVTSASTTGAVAVTTSAGCAWMASSNASWIALTSATTRTGSANIAYRVDENPTPAARTGTVTIAGETFTVTQAAEIPCQFVITPQSASVAASASTGTVTVSTTSGCAWTAAASNADFITITSGANGSGTGIVNYSVSTNATAVARSGTLTIAGQTFTVTQQGMPSTSPTNLAAPVSGSTITLTWLPPASGTPTGYVIEVGSASALTDLASVPTGSTATSFVAPNVPAGTYYFRVRAIVASMLSTPSNEVIATVVGPAAPGPPAQLTATLNGSALTLTWIAPATGGAPTAYVIEAGSAAGIANLATFATGSTQTGFSAGFVPNGRYFLRVRAQNAVGISAPSNEVQATVGAPACTNAPQPPTALQAVVSGGLVTLSWTAPMVGDTPTAYQLEAGSSMGLANLASFNTGSTATMLTASAPPGTYFVRVRAINACGTSVPTADTTVIVSP